MPDVNDLKEKLEAQIRQPATLAVEVVFDNQTSDVMEAIRISQDIVEDAKLSGAKVRAILTYGGSTYEVK